jgi:dolichol-phosphate mannosyltransferase
MISLVIPIYNEEEILHLLHDAVTSAMNPTGEEWEVVYVNDGSRDRSLAILREYQARDPHVVVVELSRNWGHMGAVWAGLNTARGDAIVLLDGDLQDPPALIPEMIDKWRAGAGVVLAQRRSRVVKSKLLGFAFHSFYRVLAMLSDYPIPLDAGIFSLMDRKVLDSINALREKNRFFPGLRAWVGYRTEYVHYDRPDRAGGEGKLSLMSRFKYATDAICSFSYKPLRISFALGMVTSAIAVLLLLGMAIAGSDSPWFAVCGVSAAVFCVGTLLLMSLGILGEYLGRIYDEVRDRPLSIIHRVHRPVAAGAALREADAFGRTAAESRVETDEIVPAA